jgi:hypothetical protein
MFSIGSRDSSVGIATGYTLEGWGLIPVGVKIFPLATASIPTLGPTQPPIQWAPGALYLLVKRQGRETDHSPQSSAEVRNGGAIPPLPHTSSRHSGQLYLMFSTDTISSLRRNPFPLDPIGTPNGREGDTPETSARDIHSKEQARFP